MRRNTVPCISKDFRLFWVLSDDRWLILLSPAHGQEALHGNFLLAHRLIQVVVNAALMDPALTFHDLPGVILCSHDWHIIPPLDTGEDSLSLAVSCMVCESCCPESTCLQGTNYTSIPDAIS